MTKTEQRLFCYLDGISPTERENKRAKNLADLSLLNTDLVPCLEEATQAVGRFLKIPISLIAFSSQTEIFIKAATGLSHLGLMNQLALSRKISQDEAYTTHVIDSQHYLIIEDTYTDNFFSRSLLAQYYGIRAYIATPLITADNICIGALEAMDIKPRQFDHRDLEYLQIVSRWCLRELENNYLQQKISKFQPITPQITSNEASSPTLPVANYLDNEADILFRIKIDLLEEIIQDLKSPLTSIIGMSSVLGKEIYGKLNEKQKEYIKAITDSGENLREIIEEIMTLDVFGENYLNLKISTVDLEMLGQEIIINLESLAIQNQQQLELTKQPGVTTWQLDKNLLKKALYYLVISVITTGEANNRVRIHISSKNNTLNITIGNYNPWLGDNLGCMDSSSSLINKILSWTLNENSQLELNNFSDSNLNTIKLSYQNLANQWDANEGKSNHNEHKKMLTLLLSCHLIELHQGGLYIQGSEERGYSYVLQLPKL